MSLSSSLKVLLETLDQKKKELDSFRPLPKELLQNLKEWYKVELTYSSNALEGNTLTASETALVLEKGLTVKGKPLKDHLEAVNHGYAFDYIIELVNGSAKDRDLRDIYGIHQLILKSIDDQNAGRLRLVQVYITGLELDLPGPIKLQELMEEFIQWLHTTQEHPVLIAADAHLKLVSIHPFMDGNGKTSRLLMNLLLMQAGFPPAVIKPEQKDEYIEVLKEAQLTGNAEPFRMFIVQCVEKSLEKSLENCIDKYLDAASKTIKTA